MVNGQRGKQLLEVEGYTYSINSVFGHKYYWNCRCRRKGQMPCKARVVTIKLPGEPYQIVKTKAIHNHDPRPKKWK